MEPVAIKLIGLGGIGCRLADEVALLCAYHYPACRLVLIDFDTYEPANASRQFYDRQDGSKAEVWRRILLARHPDLCIESDTRKVTEQNVYGIVLEGDIILLAPDKNFVRRIVSERAEEMEDITVISGGNDLEEGTVQTMLRRGGQAITQPLANPMQPEILNAVETADHAPGCARLAPAAPQLPVTNNLIAAFMYVQLINVLAERSVCDILYASVQNQIATPQFRSRKMAERKT